jgi:hypothetical protein
VVPDIGRHHDPSGRDAMDPQEYIATGSDFSELLDTVDQLPDVTITKSRSRYVVFQAHENDAEALREKFAGKYTIAPNEELRPLEE